MIIDQVLLRRIGVAVWGIPLILIPTVLGGWWFVFLIALIAFLATYEYMNLLRILGVHVFRTITATFAAVLVVSVKFSPMITLQIFIFASILFFMVSLKGAKSQQTLHVVGSISGLLYISGFLSLLALVRIYFKIQEGYLAGWFLLSFIVMIWICDTAAYLGGKTYGKHLLAPTISPKKTVEGAIFGMLGALLCGVVLVFLFKNQLNEWYILLCSFIVGTIGQGGDLVESLFKRNAGVKDSGEMLFEHGGILDRFDSLIMTSPAIFLLSYWFQLLNL
ncbi:MAG: phosphatidate cytidylyltransferase [bacterium]|nr:phosphatidate cytidylyltransferase [bacterium]